LQFDHFAEFSRLAGLTFTNDLGRRLEQADDLALGMGLAGKDRALVWRITCCTRGTMFPSSPRSLSSTTCREISTACLTPSSISAAKRRA
jgi:hypothetical protein